LLSIFGSIDRHKEQSFFILESNFKLYVYFQTLGEVLTLYYDLSTC